ncbi:MAG TPA: response regulator, partial [Hyphomicrobiales bacterium]|nr:response regulator [Hyphomicrobiales bacterium]
QQKSEAASDQPLAGLVLLVEDDEGIRQLNMIRLQRLGFDVVEAENGAVALELLRAGLRPNVIFSDVVMPGGVSGQALCEQARALDPSIRVLLTSGYSEEMVNAGAPDASHKLLRKPYKISELADALHEVLILNN